MSAEQLRRGSPRDLIGALDLVYEAAMMGRLIAESDDMKDQEAAQLDAVDTVYDFASNHYEEIEDRYAEDTAFDAAICPPDLDLVKLREIPLDHPLNDAMLITLELAAQQCVEEEAGLTNRLSTALDLVGDFWARRGSEICAETISLKIPDGPA
jgi:hypothetical protein